MTPILRIKTNGDRLAYRPSGDNDNARGTALIAAFAALEQYETLMFWGKFFVDQQLELPANYITVDGTGWGTELISDTLDSGDGFHRIYVNGKTGVKIKNFKIRQNDQVPGWNGNGIRTAGICNSCSIENVWLDRCGVAINIASSTSSDEHWHVSNCHVSYSNEQSIRTAGGSEYSKFDNNSIANARAEWGAEDLGGNNLWIGNSINSCVNGYRLGSDSNHGHSSWVGGQINHTSSQAVQIANGNGNGFQFSGTNIFGGQINLYGCKNIYFSNCNLDVSIRVNTAQALTGRNYFTNCNVSSTTTIKDTSGGTLSSSSPSDRANIIVRNCNNVATGALWAESS
jgi:hypothetical protein